MNNKDTGGPAFPAPIIDVEKHEGMTLRDYFATHASDADVAIQGEEIRIKTGIGNWRSIARYMHADEMLKARAA